ncbi:MAG: antitoxin VapB family protein [Candidatus Methanomethylicaceae archaeon]
MTKVISLSEETYKILKKLKKSGESFSDVVIRITKGLEAKPLTEYAGKWVGNDIDEIFKNILSERELSKTREI